MAGNIFIVSDPEGSDILSMSQYKTKTTDKLYVCGDLFDSTFGTLVAQKEAPMFPNDIIIDCNNVEDPKFCIKRKSYNLKNIHSVLTDPNISLIFGNRDVNKLKCKYLCELKNTTNILLISSFNGGCIKLDFDTYNKLLLEISKLSESSPWKIENMNSWYPFWNGGINTVGKDKWGKTSEEYKEKPFRTRFYEIFGSDNAPKDGGTMSAHNLLKCIPYEINKELNNLTPQNEDYYAFIVLALFKSLFIEKKIRILSPMPKNITNSNSVCGWLHTLFNNLDMKNSLCKILDFKPNIFLLSHGGIPTKLIETYKNILNLPNNLESKILTKYLRDATEYYKLQNGGFANTTTKNFSIFTINDVITQINSFFQTTITQICNTKEMDKPDNNMLFLFILSSGFTCENYLKNIKNKPDCDIPKSEEYGPIMPGIVNMRNSSVIFTIEGYTTYQIYGHKPIGYSTIVDMFENKTNNTKVFLINLDTSMSYKDTQINRGGNSQTYIKISNNNDVSIHSKIFIYIGDNRNEGRIKYNVYDGTYDKTYADKKITQFDLYVSKEIKKTTRYNFVIDNNINEPEFINYLSKTKYNNTDKINFHGISKIGKISYIVFTHTPTDAVRGNLLILNERDFKDFVTKYASPTEVSAFVNKYLKYKQKYLNLKKMYDSN